MSTTSEKEKEIRKEETQVENQPKKESFFKRHKKKLIIGGLAVIGIASGAYFYVRGNKKADAPMKDTAENKAEEAAQINEQPQRERGDREDRRNNRHGGGNNRQW